MAAQSISAARRSGRRGGMMKPSTPVGDEVGRGGVGGGEDGQAAGERLEQDLAEAFGDGGKDEEVGGLVGGDELGR